MEDKKIILDRFKRLYKNCVLFAAQLDGFCHNVYFKDENGNKHIESMSLYAPEQYQKNKLYNNGIYRSFNEDKTKVLFLGYSHLFYKHNPQEYIYKSIKEW